MSDAANNNVSSDNQNSEQDPVVNTEEVYSKAGGRVFKTKEELEQAFDGLSKTVGDKGRREGALKKAITDDETLSPEEKEQLQEQFLSDPVAVLKLYESKAVEKAKKAIQAEGTKDLFWENLFKSHPHLAVAREQIQHDVYTRLFDKDFEQKSAEEQSQVIAEKWAFLKPTKEADPKYQAPVGGSSNASGKPAPVAQPTDDKPKGLSDLINEVYKN